MASLVKAGKSPSWVLKAYRLLSQIMKVAVDNELISANRCRGHRLPRLPEPDPRILSVEEVDRLVAASRRPFDLIILLLAYTGIRIGEALSLRRNDVLGGGMVLRVDERKADPDGPPDFDTPKAHQIRLVGLPGFVAERLREHLSVHVGPATDAFLFVGRTGNPLRYNSWKRWKFDPAVTAAGLDGVTPHDLRATHGSWVADSHGVMAAAKRLGHSNANVTTRHYARALDGRDAEIAADLDRRYREREQRAATGTDGHVEDLARGSHEGAESTAEDEEKEEGNGR
jgi:integrase